MFLTTARFVDTVGFLEDSESWNRFWGIGWLASQIPRGHSDEFADEPVLRLDLHLPYPARM